MSDLLRPQLLLDLGRTLFDTDAFTTAALSGLALRLGVSTTTLLDEVRSFYVPSARGAGLYYDMPGHLAHHRLGVEDLLPIIEQTEENFLYDDVLPMLSVLEKWNVTPAILTHGERRTQELKLAIAKPLGRFAAHITLEPKGEYIARQWPDSKGMIADDKVIASLPPGWTGVLLERANSVPLSKAEDLPGPIIFSLTGIPRLYKQFYGIPEHDDNVAA